MVLERTASQLRERARTRLQPEFAEEKELIGVAVTLESEEFSLIALSSFDFENLALKLNRLNLRSPDLKDDWRVLKLTTLGTRAPVRRY